MTSTPLYGIMSLEIMNDIFGGNSTGTTKSSKLLEIFGMDDNEDDEDDDSDEEVSLTLSKKKEKEKTEGPKRAEARK